MSERKRTILTFEPQLSGGLIKAELKNRKHRKERAALRQTMEEAVISYLGPRFPKLLGDIDLNAVFGTGKIPAHLTGK